MTMKNKGTGRADMVKKHMKAARLNASLGHSQAMTMPAVPREEWNTMLQETWGKMKKKITWRSQYPPFNTIWRG